MIAHLKGQIASIGIDNAVIDVGGVGYFVSLSTRSLAALGRPGEAVIIHTEMLVGEDFMRLVGFANEAERDWFRLLVGVQGVGARVALAILSALEPAELSRAIAAQDKAMVARANGVGPKLAERIVRELKDVVAAVATGPLPIGGARTAPLGAQEALQADAIAALTGLGYRPGEAHAAVGAALAELGSGPDAPPGLDALVRLALRKAAK